jgi:hypothetical protein
VSVIAAPLAPEVPGDAAAISVLVLVLGHKALMAGPGLHERAVYAEMQAREQAMLLRDRHHLVGEPDDRVVVDQAFAVIAEHRRHPHSVVHRQPDEPAKQQFVLHQILQLPLGPNPLEGLQQHLGRSPLTLDAYIAVHIGSNFSGAALAVSRILRSGWHAGTKPSSLRIVSKLSVKVPAPRMEITQVGDVRLFCLRLHDAHSRPVHQQRFKAQNYRLQSDRLPAYSLEASEEISIESTNYPYKAFW